ncbi:hypothetical protein JANAI62_06560 [Jannaschia pagri]|uniref:DoxX-like family protein n=1 Tax=Jannaschia pagri TaxID=2829797 RepID=A0ABQ4NHX6_9RHOB|nr:MULTISPECIES: DoxX-like family protein [unclassified Jannaschia]GIT89860.1 hypothetical protein JANAI61_03180 [Jannaschia sp. AI_61]GIT94033.1 hypothetical protein JANAI62_06560 [Jannaschia sp. AI_62]
MPATVQERWFARLWALLPVGIAVLCLFWVASGAIAIARWPAAVSLHTSRDVPDGLAIATVIGGAIADIALGLAVLWRPWARRACQGMTLLAGTYLVGGTALTPDLWADPLGPFVKVLPALFQPLMVAAILDTR